MKNIYKIFGVSLLVISALLLGCEDRSDLTEPALPNTGDANFSKFVSIGNSLMAGYQNRSLYQSSQLNSIGALIARQVGGVIYEQPIIDDPGTPDRLEVAALDLAAGQIDLQENSSQGIPTNPTASAYNNLGIPGILMVDVLQTKESPSLYSGENALIDLVLRKQGKTVLEEALSQQPTFVTVCIGNNDILGYATSGGVLPHFPKDKFAELYPLLLGALAQSGAKGAVANIPDVSVVPYFTTIGPGIGMAIKPAFDGNLIQGLVYQHSTTVIGLATPDDLIKGNVLITITASSFTGLLGDTEGKYYQMIGQIPPEGVDTNYPFGFTPQNPWPTSLILDPEEMKVAKDVTTSFNNTIAAVTQAVGYKLVDLNSFFNGIAQNGYAADGIKFSTAFVAGGLFSLDGVHPTSRGYAVVANEFIKVINSGYNATIPLVNVSTIPGSLPLYGVTPKKINSIKSAPGAFDKILF